MAFIDDFFLIKILYFQNHLGFSQKYTERDSFGSLISWKEKLQKGQWRIFPTFH